MTKSLKSLFLPLCIMLMAALLVIPKNSAALEPVVVGVLHSERYPYAVMMKNSLEMALEVINKGGGIKGRPLKLFYADDRGKPKEGEKAVKDLIKKNEAVMLVGAYQSSNALFMARVADKLDRPLLVCTAADDRITQRKWRNVYRLNAPASEYSKGLEDFFLKTIKPRSMSILYENSPFGTGGALRMMWFCRENDIDIRKIEPYHKERLRSDYFQRIIAPVKEDPPNVIYMVSYLKDAVALVREIQKSGIKSLLSGGAGGFTSQKFIQMAGSVAENLLTATLWTPQLRYPGTDEYYNKYMGRHASPPDYHGAEGYSALLVVADVLTRAESLTPEGIRTALDNTDMTTPFGPIKFDSYGKFERQNSLPTQVLQVIDGKFECVWPPGLASNEFVPPPNWRRSH